MILFVIVSVILSIDLLTINIFYLDVKCKLKKLNKFTVGYYDDYGVRNNNAFCTRCSQLGGCSCSKKIVRH